ncbi:hypothetical protein J2S00_003327 [Caldalkalibacillus uzonensis]|uniref:Uncharacterized protein n=1 Tax=Caldalkalibacillus uzonensis TaxID=353224 RepID=A0ABU0CWJ5_9BACI|nr:DUF6147 family protein [Caldalkalibacillus uzonensis]MDQ0340512.1 hypothetical protein [Caldalkalibacillus uzonensis]
MTFKQVIDDSLHDLEQTFEYRKRCQTGQNDNLSKFSNELSLEICHYFGIFSSWELILDNCRLSYGGEGGERSMFKKAQFILAVFLILAGIFLGSAEVFAEEIPPEPTEGSQSPYQDWGSSNTSGDVAIQSTQYLKAWESSISRISGNYIRVSGFSEAYSKVDTIGVELFLQYWNGQQWIDIAKVGDYKRNNTTYVSGTELFTVSSGYYYRARGVHYIYKDGLRERMNSYTSYIYVR